MDMKNVENFKKAYEWLNERAKSGDMSDEGVRKFCKCCLLSLNKAPYIMEEDEGADSSVVFEWSIYFDEEKNMALPCIHYIMSVGAEEKMGYFNMLLPELNYDCSIFDKDLREYRSVVLASDIQTA